MCVGAHVPFDRQCSQDIGQGVGMSAPRLSQT